MFSPKTMILLSNTAALCKDRAEGSGAVSLQVPPTSSISVLSRLPPLSLDPPVTRSTCMIMIKYVCIHNWNKLHNFSLIRQIGPTGVIKPSNIELRQNLSLSSPAVSRHSLQRRAKWIFIPSRDDVLASSCNATGIAVKNKLNIVIYNTVEYILKSRFGSVYLSLNVTYVSDDISISIWLLSPRGNTVELKE